MNKIVVLSGGDSPEREISLISARNIASRLTKDGYDVESIDTSEYQHIEDFIAILKDLNPDIIFNGLHGGVGENGKIQAILEMTGFKFTGSPSNACMITMDKHLTKLIAKDCGLPIAKDILLQKGDTIEDVEIEEIGCPLIVKPNSAGSSVGISLVNSKNDISQAITEAFKYDDNVLIEQFIPGRELTVTIIGGEAKPVVEIKPKQGWYDYKNKYTSGNTEYIAPAELEEQEVEVIQSYAEKLFKRCYCKGYARIDFRYDGNKFYLLEVNTLPGMTELSLTPMSVKADGIDFKDLLKTIIDFGLKGE